MINQWENIPQLKCEYDLPLLCKETGRSILDDLKIDPVSQIGSLNIKKLYLLIYEFILCKEKKMFNVIMLFVLAVLFRITAFTILWFKGNREPIKMASLLGFKRKKFKKECVNAWNITFCCFYIITTNANEKKNSRYIIDKLEISLLLI